MKTFNSKIDLWLLIVLFLLIGLSIYTVIEILLKQTNLIDYLISIFMALLGVFLPIGLITSTKYVVEGNLLIIKAGFFKWEVNILEITEVRKTKNPLSSPALSLDRIEIKYKNNKKIMISPNNLEEFLKAINQKLK